MAERARPSAASIALVALPALLAVGALTFAAPCGAHDDGSLSCCHYAGNVVAALGALAACLAALRLAWPSQAAGLDVGVALAGLVAAATPGGLVGLCLMASMRCQALTRPFALALGLATCALAALDLVRQRRAARAGA